MFDEVTYSEMLQYCNVQYGVEGVCDLQFMFFILQKTPQYSKLHLKTKSQNFHFHLKYHNLSLYTEHSVQEMNWYSLVIREDGNSISSMMVSWGIACVLSCHLKVIRLSYQRLPRICLMIKFSEYRSYFISCYWFLLSSVVGKGYRKQNNQWDDNREVWTSKRFQATLFSWILDLF